MEYITFTWIDYTLFILMFGLSAATGLYFGCYQKQTTTKDYLLGGKTMNIFPVAMSMVASTLSGVALIGIPSEIYMYGTQYSMLILSFLLVGVGVRFIFLPVFYKLQLLSIFEYFELRFDKTIRLLASVMFSLLIFIGLPFTIYAPALAFNQVSGVNIYFIAVIVASICIFYTTIGGLKAVVWADTIQLIVTLCAMFVIFVVGAISVGGPTVIWERAKLGNRIEFFNMDPNPTIRNTFWTVVIGNFSNWLFFIGGSQATIQRFLTVSTFKDAKRMLIIFIALTMFAKSLACFSGLIMYAKYFDCDPLKAGYIKKADQIVPFYVLDMGTKIPGLSGLFIAGLFGTGLSTLSTYMNSLSGIIYADFMSPFLPANISQKKASAIMKITTFCIGMFSVGLVFVIDKLGSILQILYSFCGIWAGPTLGLFILGLLIPVANRKGALCGVLSSIALMSLIIIKNQHLVYTGGIKALPKPLSDFGCNVTYPINATSIYNNTLSNSSVQALEYVEEPLWLFRISFHYYTLMGALLTVIIGVLVSWFTRNINDKPPNPDFLSPCVHRFMSKSSADTFYEAVEKEIEFSEITKPTSS